MLGKTHFSSADISNPFGFVAVLLWLWFGAILSCCFFVHFSSVVWWSYITLKAIEKYFNWKDPSAESKHRIVTKISNEIYFGYKIRRFYRLFLFISTTLKAQRISSTFFSSHSLLTQKNELFRIVGLTIKTCRSRQQSANGRENFEENCTFLCVRSSWQFFFALHH